MPTDTATASRSGSGMARRLRQLGLLGISQAGVTVIAFLTQVLLARSLPKADFGAFMSVMSLVTLAGPLAIFGVAEFWLQRFGREGSRAFRWVRPSIALVAVTSGLLVVALVGWGLLDRHDAGTGDLRIGLAPIILSLVAMALSGSALQLQGAYGRLAALQLAPQVGRLLVAVLTLSFGLSALMVALGYALVAAVMVAMSVLMIAPFWYGRATLEGHPPVPRRPTRPPRARHLVAATWLFLLGSLFYQLGMQLGVVVSAEFLSSESAAVLAVPMTLLTAIYLLPRIVYQQYFLAKLHRWSRSNRNAVLIAYRAGTVGMIGLGLLLGAVVALVGRYAIPLIFGAEYRTSVPVMAILALAIPLRFGAASVESLLMSGGLVRQKVLYQGLGSLAYLAALATAIPLFGVAGAAWATVLSEAIVLVLFWSRAKRDVVAGADLPSWAEIRRTVIRS
ncbi:Membrane protein involved in the export of O-antigen and teichoic acid [Micromonospora cremea]|uniref:Membrane protein involved in the export of O-antigen and teichoic acid n=1 Tax=Micromonospora cremea TaxID=709881 RepID=A0A1N6AQY6_9ACTN|nr:Membrane protein involved in the export of O-antigen and teichoic acid [Micromonospora cremea]